MTTTATPTIARPGQYGAANNDDLAKSAMEDIPDPNAPGSETPEAVDNRAPIEKWREGLRKADITEAQAETILDSMLSKGYWEREYKLFHGKVTLKLRTRDAQNLNRIMSTIDRMRVPAPSLIEEHISMLNLAGSIVQLRSVTLPHPDIAKASVDEIEEAFEKRQEFTRRISGPLMPAIRVALVHFDKVVAAALADGADEGF